MPILVIVESVNVPGSYLEANKPAGRSEISSNTGDEVFWTVRSFERCPSVAGRWPVVAKLGIDGGLSTQGVC